MNLDQFKEHKIRIRRALVSISDKSGIVEFTQRLRRLDIEIISTGGTFDLLSKAGLQVTKVSDVTNFPEILDGRVKTLHPAIHAGLLARGNHLEHAKQLREQQIHPIDLLVVNLYPFEKTIQKENIGIEDALEQIDIGGPAMVRAAAKNFESVTVVTSPSDYESILEELETSDREISLKTRFLLAQKAFSLTAQYDQAIASYLCNEHQSKELPQHIFISAQRTESLRYGENPHQSAAIYGDFTSYFAKLHGKELSFNNILDLQAAFRLTCEFDQPTAVIVKHNNPCGVGTGANVHEAYLKALSTDSKSAFGGIVAFNEVLEEESAESINLMFLEVIVAPGYTEEALKILTKKKDRRIVRSLRRLDDVAGYDIRSILGGFLVQERDTARLSPDLIKVVTVRHPSQDELEAMLFAWRVVKHVKSNAIVYAQKDRTLGIGAGQMSRVDSCRIAAQKAYEARINLQGCAVASDAFFPFPDGLLEAVQAGATAVIQPGGSIRDEEVIDAANANNISMIFTGVRHFLH